MLIVDDKLLSEDLFDAYFVCNLEKCKGACCIEGDNGAPLEFEETQILAKNLQTILPYLPESQQEIIKERNFFETDQDGDLVTTCKPSGECVFSKKDANGNLSCMIEVANKEHDFGFQKPLSCHLYPIRVSTIGEYTVLNYHKWDICSPACSLGTELQVPVFRFLKNPLERAFGKDFYDQLEEIYKSREALKK